MPKHDFLTPKAIANRQKSIGLQKLRWYCQMCQKQCRDENGFKCHTSSEGHLRQMRVFAENPNSVLDEFSREFERGYLEILSHRHGTKRVKANTVYQEYIGDKHHIHMNATRWTSLTGFCMHLGREGKAVVDETEKGWFIEYIDRDPKMLARQLQAEQRKKYELDEEERHKQEIAAQILAAEQRLGESSDAPVDNSLVRPVDQEKVALSLHMEGGHSLLKKRALKSVFAVDDEDEEEQPKKISSGVPRFIPPSSHTAASFSSTAAATSIKAKPEAQPQPNNHHTSSSSSGNSGGWLQKDIWVKVVSESVHGGRLFRQKGVVRRLLGEQEAEVEVGSECFPVRQSDLETVIPKVGNTVLILGGRHRGLKGELLRVNVEDFNCDVRLQNGKEVAGLEYEDVSKLECS
mmetsp:Transcript_17970/g.24647  ORF Transcript_17970/g.24647 Transcript_17970/m.24647 type:complete len:405 (+) Transcript_17970:43-1257(+)